MNRGLAGESCGGRTAGVAAWNSPVPVYVLVFLLPKFLQECLAGKGGADIAYSNGKMHGVSRLANGREFYQVYSVLT